MATIINPSIAAKALNWCRTQRVAVTGLWNSNGLKNGYGLIEAIQQSFVTAGIKIFAAGPVTLTSTNSSTNANDGNLSARANTSCVGWSRVVTSTGANSLLDSSNVLALHTVEAKAYQYGRSNDGSGTEYPPFYRMLHFKNNTAVGYGGVASGISFGATASSPYHINPAAALRSDHWYSNATADGGTFRPAAIEGAVPNVHVANYGSNVIVPAGTPTGFSRATWDVPAGTRTTQLRVGPSAGIASPADMRPTGEVGFGFQLTWERDATAGVLVAPFESMGGWSTRDFAHNLARVDGSQCYTEAIDHWIEVIVRPIVDAGQTPRVIFFLNEGSNEASETATSIPNAYAGGSLAAWKDNVAYVISVWRDRWAAKGYAADDFVVALCPDHPNLSTGETARAGYATSGIEDLVTAEPTRTFGFNSSGRWTPAMLKSVGRGLETLYERAPASQSITSIPITIVGADIGMNCVNAYALTDVLWIAGTNSTPHVNGTWEMSARSGTTVTLSNPDPDFSISVAGTTGESRVVDSLHLAVSGANGATVHGYRQYWAGIFEDWSAAGSGSSTGGPRLGLGLGLGVAGGVGGSGAGAGA